MLDFCLKGVLQINGQINIVSTHSPLLPALYHALVQDALQNGNSISVIHWVWTYPQM